MKNTTFMRPILLILAIILVSCGDGGGGGDSPGNQHTPGICAEFTYSDWSEECQSDNTQMRDILSSNPSGCVGGNPKTVKDCTFELPEIGMEIAIAENSHTVVFNVRKGYIKGLYGDREVYPNEVLGLIFNSDRIGWQDDSLASVDFDYEIVGDTITITITGTVNNDLGQWSLKLSDGAFVYLNPDKWEITGKEYVIKDGKITYGNYQRESIEFYSPRTVMIDFNSNMISLVNESGLTPDDIKRVQWNSDIAGWGDSSTIFSPMETDAEGNYYVLLQNMPCDDTGNFSIKKIDGSFVYFKVSSKWILSDNVILNTDIWKFVYSNICN